MAEYPHAADLTRSQMRALERAFLSGFVSEQTFDPPDLDELARWGYLELLPPKTRRRQRKQYFLTELGRQFMRE
jgi:hypothetical protein